PASLTATQALKTTASSPGAAGPERLRTSARICTGSAADEKRQKALSNKCQHRHVCTFPRIQGRKRLGRSPKGRPHRSSSVEHCVKSGFIERHALINQNLTEFA